MNNVIILIKAGSGLDRTNLEKIEGETFNTTEELLDAIDEDGRKLFLNNEIQVWNESDFMDAWNDTDGDFSGLTIEDSFIGFSKVKFI